MTTRGNALSIVDEVRTALAASDPAELDRLAEAILVAHGIFCTGQGRSGLMIRAFAMRLVHVGLNAYVVGETTTPAIASGDLLLAASGSGQTRTTLAIVQAAQERGAETALITAHRESPVGRACDLVVELRTPITTQEAHGHSIQPPGSLYEQALLITCDAIIMALMARLGTTEDEMRARHTKLE